MEQVIAESLQIWCLEYDTGIELDMTTRTFQVDFTFLQEC